MRTSQFSPIIIAACATLTACGGGSDSGIDSASTMASMSSSSASVATMASTAYAKASETPSSWVACATEETTCSFSGTAQVRFGAGDKFVVKTLTGPVSCSNNVFGDPLPGYAKTCSIGVTPTAAPSSGEMTWTVCAKEYGSCAFSGSAQVRYGTADKYVSKTLTGPVSCTNEVFGDPAPGYGKSCELGTAVVSKPPVTTPGTTPGTVPGTTPSSWTVCANEGGSCNVSAGTQVRYGSGDKYVVKIVGGPFACTNEVFGDPAPNYGKSCSIGGTDNGSTAPTNPTDPVTPPATPAPAPSNPGPSNPVPNAAGAVTTVQLVNTTATAQANASATFGQTFRQGDLRNGETVTGRSAGGASVPLQVDVKARHADGSVRHAVITAQLSTSAANGVDNISLIKATAGAAATPVAPTTLLNSGFTASFNATIGGVRYTASADELLKSGKYTTWLSGALVNEWLVQAPLKNAAGVAHPHLMAQFAIRAYAGQNSARVDVTIENGWAFEASPQNFKYDAQVLVGGQPVFSQAGMTHYHHGRWREVFWWGKAQPLNVRHNTSYLIATKAVPNFDQALGIPESTLSYWKNQWSSSKTGPMQTGVAEPFMPTTGARHEIGIMPSWNVLYLLTMDQRMKDVAVGMSDIAGTWPAHYRDKNTGRPVTLASYPYMSVISSGGDTINPATKKSEAFPACPESVCAQPLAADTAHQPSFSYVPYLLTGDYYHLEELQFWANFSSFRSNPNYRAAGKGILLDEQVRALAWSLRTLAEAAYITPDNDPQKSNFTTIVNNNIEWYDAQYTNNPAANKLGVIVNGYSIVYENVNALAPWQDDMLTGVLGHVVELGFTNAQPFLAWKTKFAVDRMVGAGFCAIQAPAYNLFVRDSEKAPMYTTIAQVYKASTGTSSQLACDSAALATALQVRPGEMVGGLSPIGQQGIMQPALAYAVGINPNGAKAWAQFSARQFKPNYTFEPNYAIVPR